MGDLKICPYCTDLFSGEEENCRVCGTQYKHTKYSWTDLLGMDYYAKKKFRKKLLGKLPDNELAKQVMNKAKDYDNYVKEKRKNSNKPKCPTCQSNKVEKISTTKRVVSTSIFGLASSNIGKTMECKNCGYKW